MEIRVNRIGRGSRHGTGNDIGGGGEPPPPPGGTPNTITNITADSINPIGTQAQVNCPTPHSLSPGMSVTISGNSNATYNSTFVVGDIPTAFVFDIEVPYDVDGTGGTWVRA